MIPLHALSHFLFVVHCCFITEYLRYCLFVALCSLICFWGYTTRGVFWSRLCTFENLPQGRCTRERYPVPFSSDLHFPFIFTSGLLSLPFYLMLSWFGFKFYAVVTVSAMSLLHLQHGWTRSLLRWNASCCFTTDKLSCAPIRMTCLRIYRPLAID